MSLLEGGVVRNLLEPQHPTQVGPVVQIVNNAPVVGFAELLQHEDGQQLGLRKVFLGELRGVGR